LIVATRLQQQQFRMIVDDFTRLPKPEEWLLFTEQGAKWEIMFSWFVERLELR
jgi:hypothetical protein